MHSTPYEIIHQYITIYTNIIIYTAQCNIILYVYNINLYYLTLYILVLVQGTYLLRRNSIEYRTNLGYRERAQYTSEIINALIKYLLKLHYRQDFFTAF